MKQGPQGWGDSTSRSGEIQSSVISAQVPLWSGLPDGRGGQHAMHRFGLTFRRMRDLIMPTTRLHSAWLEAHLEWGPGLHEDGFGLGPADEVESPAGFATWVARLTGESHPTTPVQAGQPGCTYRWIV